MLAIKVLGGLAFFIPAFMLVGLLVGKLSEKHHTAIAFLMLFAGLAVVLVLATAYGHAVR